MEIASISADAGCPAGWICPKKPIYDSQIGAWFEPWWAGQTPPSGTISWTGTSRYQPLINGQGKYYDCGDAADIRAEFSAIKNAGIDYLILDNTNTIIDKNGQITKPWIQANISKMFEVDAALPVADQIPMAVAIGGHLMLSKSVDLQNRDANYVASNWRSSPVYFRWEGIPLLVNYNQYSLGQNTFAPQWVDEGEGWRFTTRNAADNINLAANNLPFGSTAGAHGWWGWTQTSPVIHTEAMTVSPGADNTHRNAIGGCLPFNNCNETIDRQGGASYVRQWLEAVRRNPKTVVISSWNEFSDETAIETAWPNSDISHMWTDGYGNAMPDLYVQITKGYTNLRKGLMDGWYYRDESSYDIYLVSNSALIKQNSPIPPKKVVIILPAHTLRDIMIAKNI